MDKLSDILGESEFGFIAEDPVMFVQAFDRKPWKYQEKILQNALQRDQGGKFKSKVVVISLPRQNGKSTLSGWAALWRLYTAENQEIISVANDKDQASIILNDARRIIRNSEILYNLLDGKYGLTRTEIRLQNGNRWLIKSADAVFSRGLRPSVVLYDELGWATDRDLFDVLSAGQAAQENPLILVTSTVGPIKHGVLWDLFELARGGDKTINLIYHTENPSPLISQEFLDQQQAILPPNIFAREHQNLWGEGSDAYCTEDDWKRAISEGDPRRDADKGPCYCFVDLGWAHDETALSVGKKNGETGQIEIIVLETWKGSQSQNVDFSSIERRLIELASLFNIRKVDIESPQGVSMVQRLNLVGVTSSVLHPTAKSNQEHWGALYNALKAGSIRLPNDPKLRQQLLTLTIKTAQTGWRVEDVPSIHQDRARAVAGVAAMLKSAVYTPAVQQETIPSTWKPVMDYSVTDGNQSRWKVG